MKPEKCPKDKLKFGVCGSWLGLVYEVVGTKPSKQCCNLIEGLADLEAALCLCTAIKANALGAIKLEVPIALRFMEQLSPAGGAGAVEFGGELLVGAGLELGCGLSGWGWVRFWLWISCWCWIRSWLLISG
ncbi:hypothetical protein Patl1_00223 [Pistacia atlantica]|uniref:Uncharacterized protein n=1 Tax=Pistacia atlantica TaxID=434234 RepID=A0ACC1C4M3_9ROSI|nr:hypothetical protein Patl1_00223 [Pistacia atlantica]